MRPCADLGDYRGAVSGSARRGGKAQMGEGELVLLGAGRSHCDLDSAHADPHQRADLQQLEPDRAAGCLGELGVAQGDAAQGAEQYIGHRANHRRNWLARMVAAEVRSANRSSWHSLMRFSISPRAQ